MKICRKTNVNALRQNCEMGYSYNEKIFLSKTENSIAIAEKPISVNMLIAKSVILSGASAKRRMSPTKTQSIKMVVR